MIDHDKNVGQVLKALDDQGPLPWSSGSTDPYERADQNSNIYYDWVIDHVFLFVPAQAFVAEFLTSFKEFPHRQ